MKAGRFGQVIGGGLAFDGTFDGAQFNAGNDKVNFQAAYGYMVSGNIGLITGNSKLDSNGNPQIDPNGTVVWDNSLCKSDNVTHTYVGLNGKLETTLV